MRERERDVVGIICVIIYDDLALKAWTQRREREGETNGRRKEGKCQNRKRTCIETKLLCHIPSHPCSALFRQERQLILFKAHTLSTQMTSFLCTQIKTPTIALSKDTVKPNSQK